MSFEPEIDPDLFDEDFVELLEEDVIIPDDYDDHYNDEDELEENEEGKVTEVPKPMEDDEDEVKAEAK